MGSVVCFGGRLRSRLGLGSLSNKTNVILVAAVLLVLASGAVNGLDLSEHDTEETALAELKLVGLEEGGVDNAKEAVVEAMSRGWWNYCSELIAVARKDGVDLSSPVYQGASAIRRKLTQLTESLQASRYATGISPAFQWAQSPDSVFLSLKFSHKLDTPATLGCEAQNVTINARRIDFRVDCARKRKKFHLGIDLLKDIDSSGSTWSMASVGRASITLKKAEKSTWSRLLKGKNKPGNMHVWWSMKERHEKDMEEFQKTEGSKPAASATSEPKKSDKEDAEPKPAPTPAPTPPPPSERDVKVAAINKKRTREKRLVDARITGLVSKEESAARAKKREVDEEARAKKKAIDKELDDAKKRLRTEGIAEQKTIDEASDKEIAELGADGSTNGAAKTDL